MTAATPAVPRTRLTRNLSRRVICLAARRRTYRRSAGGRETHERGLEHERARHRQDRRGHREVPPVADRRAAEYEKISADARTKADPPPLRARDGYVVIVDEWETADQSRGTSPPRTPGLRRVGRRRHQQPAGRHRVGGCSLIQRLLAATTSAAPDSGAAAYAGVHASRRSRAARRPACPGDLLVVAAPLGGMTLAQLGADMIRIDPIGGAADVTRWPLAPTASPCTGPG